ncbi:MAG: sodium:proton antiporter [Hyphomicrobiales bacterium]
MEDIAGKIALIGALGITAQWIAWRFHLPAIVLLAAAGILAGPVFGLLDPRADFEGILRPAIGLAVAVILFEGGLTLNFSEIKDTSKAVRRLVFVGAPIAWFFGAMAAHFVGGLGWPAAAILSGIFVVTGPTVIMPLLRNAKLTKRPSALLRWEAIIADPVGALFAVLAFELFLVFGAVDSHHDLTTVLIRFAIAMPVGAIGGWYLGKTIAGLFIRGQVPEFLKAPIILIALLASYVATNHILEEAGLLTVTAMGVAMGNSRIASLAEMRRFKEVITILLVSALFVILTATLEPATLQSLTLRDAAYIAILLFVVRPLSVWVSTIGADLTWQERFLTGWIAPRGIVAVAVTGLFGATLSEMGNPDGDRMVALAFAVVFITVILHGFSLSPLAKALGLSSSATPGLLLVGANPFAVAVAQEMKDNNIPVTIADSNFTHLRDARYADIPVYFGEILSEVREHRLDVHSFSHLVATSDNDAYNALVCTELAHEFGRTNVLQLAASADVKSDNQTMSFTVGGRRLFLNPIDLDEAIDRIKSGETIQTTLLSDEFTFDDYLATRSERNRVIGIIKTNGGLEFATPNGKPKAQAGDKVLSLGPPQKSNQDIYE